MADDADSGLLAYRLDLAYDGRRYFGWQRLSQKPTIQGAVEDVLSALFDERSGFEAPAARTAALTLKDRLQAFACQHESTPPGWSSS